VVRRCRAEPLEKGHLFSAKYVPFTPTDVDESYHLDEVIYRCVPRRSSIACASDFARLPYSHVPHVISSVL
jgi:hypothetical protein